MHTARILLLVPALLLVLPLGAQTAPPAGQGADQKPRPKVLGVDLTYLANEGFFLESGRYSILIDAFVRDPVDIYAALPDAAYKDLVNARPPYDGLTIVLVSHDHPDHVQYRGLEKYLSNNSQAQLMTSAQVLKALKDNARDFDSIQRRLTHVPTVRGTPNKIVQEEMSIELFELEGGGKSHDGLVNIAHLIELGGVKILHVGDAEPSVENFSPYKLATRGIDLAIVPYWYLGSAEGVRVLHEEIRARAVAACHVPPAERDKLSQLLPEQFPEVILFKEPLDKRSFQPGATEPAGGDTEQGG